MRKNKILVKGLCATVALTITLGLIFSAGATETESNTTVVLKEGTPVILKLTTEISSQKAQVGDTIRLAVARDVKVEGYIVIAVNARATGEITMAEPTGIGGQKGRVGFTIFDTVAVDGTTVMLRMSLSRAGQGKEALALGGGFLICPLLLLARGEQATFPVGTEVKAYVENDTTVKIITSS